MTIHLYTLIITYNRHDIRTHGDLDSYAGVDLISYEYARKGGF